MDRYYGINGALGAYLQAQSIACPIIKYGVDPATLKDASKDQAGTSVFPFLRSHISNVRQQAWTSKESGILTEFDFQLSFFTAPPDPALNDTAYWLPFEVANIGLTDISRQVLTRTDGTTWADILDLKYHYEFEVRTGSPSPAAFVLARMRAVCGYAAQAGIADPTISTDLDNAITYDFEPE